MLKLLLFKRKNVDLWQKHNYLFEITTKQTDALTRKYVLILYLRKNHYMELKKNSGNLLFNMGNIISISINFISRDCPQCLGESCWLRFSREVRSDNLCFLWSKIWNVGLKFQFCKDYFSSILLLWRLLVQCFFCKDISAPNFMTERFYLGIIYPLKKDDTSKIRKYLLSWKILYRSNF